MSGDVALRGGDRRVVMAIISGASIGSLLVVSLTALLGLLAWPERGEAQGSSIVARRFHPAVATAVVVDIVDPEAAGRIKVRFPWLRDDAEMWARVALPLGGNRTGLWALPEVGDEVLVAFEHGDLRRPVVLGSLWNGQDRPGQ
jgi:hypothetical protein